MQPDYIFVHCSASRWGDAEEIRKWHLARKWSDIGYHFVITNGHAKTSRGPVVTHLDGAIQLGRAENVAGAHVRGWNSKSLGICLIGREGNFTANQMISAYGLVVTLMVRYGIPVENVLGHYEADPKKTCPDLDMKDFRDRIRRLYHGTMAELSCSEDL